MGVVSGWELIRGRAMLVLRHSLDLLRVLLLWLLLYVQLGLMELECDVCARWLMVLLRVECLPGGDMWFLAVDPRRSETQGSFAVWVPLLPLHHHFLVHQFPHD